MKKKLCLVSIIAFLMSGVFAYAQNLSLSVTITSGTVTYTNPGWWSQSNPTWIDGSLTVTKTTTGSSQPYTVDLSPNADTVGGTYPRNANWIYYGSGTNSSVYIDNSEIYKTTNHSTNGNVIKMWDATGIGDANVTSSNVFTGTLTDSSPSVTYTFSAVFWQTSSMSAGFYELPITFRLRNEAFVSGGVPSTSPVSTITMVLRFEIGTSSTIYFKSGSYEIFELAFDEVTAQTPKAFTISVQANFRFYLSLSSKNGGYLKNSSASDTIPYTLSIDGTTIPLSAGTYKFSKRQSSTGFGTNSKDYSAILTIGDITSYSAGTYTDILSFTVTSN